MTRNTTRYDDPQVGDIVGWRADVGVGIGIVMEIKTVSYPSKDFCHNMGEIEAAKRYRLYVYWVKQRKAFWNNDEFHYCISD